MRVLIVEDDDFRMELFNELFADDDLWRARDAAMGVARLEQRNYDLIMLDHDLGPGGTGQDVARRIAEDSAWAPYVIVHSWNASGAAAIAWILQDAGIIRWVAPFGPGAHGMVGAIAQVRALVDA